MIAVIINGESVVRMLAIVFIFGLMIVVHELGHLLVARLARMRVHEFSVGFGPALLALHKVAGRWRATLFPSRPRRRRIAALSTADYRQTMERLQAEGLSPAEAAARASELARSQGEAAREGQEQEESTTWSLRPFIPVGGYVNIAGIDPEEDVPDGFDKKPVAWRIAVITAGPFMNVVLAIVLYVVIGSVFGLPGPPQPEVGKVLEGRPAAKAGLKAGDKFLRVGDLTVATGGDQEVKASEVAKIRAEIEDSPDRPVPVVVQRDGRRVRLTVVPEAKTDKIPVVAIRGLEFPELYYQAPFVGRVEAGSPASGLGIEEGDLLTSVNDTPVETVRQAHRALVAVASQPAYLTFSRDGVARVMKVAPSPPAERKQERELKYRTTKLVIGQIGIAFHTRTHRLGLGPALSNGFGTFYAQLRGLVGVLGLVITRRAPAEVAGPVGITRMLYRSAEVDWREFLALAAAFCLWIAVFNLIPLPALDGSRVAFLIGEAIRGKPLLAPAREAIVHIVGMMLFLALLVLITYKDIVDWVRPR